MENDISNIILALRNGDYHEAILLCDYAKDQGTTTERLAVAQLSRIAHEAKESIIGAAEIYASHYSDDDEYVDGEMACIRARYSIIVNTLLDSIVGVGRI